VIINLPEIKTKQVTIGEVFKVSSGGTPSRKKDEYFTDGNIAWVKTGDLKGKFVNPATEFISQLGLDNSSAKLFPPKTVLLAMYGATIGACSILPFEAATNQACAALLPSDDCDENFLYYYLSSIKPYLINKGVGGAQPNISAGLIKNLKIPLPPLAEQQKIAAVLDAADSLRQKDQQLIGKYNALSQSLFLELFGDPVTNPKEWNISAFGKSLIDIVGGKSVGGEQRQIKDHEKAVLKISAVTTGAFNSLEYKVVESCELPEILVHPQKGNLLFSRANTRELVGATCIVDKDYEYLFLPDKIWRLDLKLDIASNWYLRFLLTHEGFRENLRKVATGTSGSMLNISKAKLKQLKIPLPPITLQNQFAERIQSIETQKQQAQASLEKSEALFNSLLQRAFKGELT